MIWHYGVFKGRPYRWPACQTPDTLPSLDAKVMMKHGVTIVRGDVNCPNCLQAMGIA